MKWVYIYAEENNSNKAERKPQLHPFQAVHNPLNSVLFQVHFCYLHALKKYISTLYLFMTEFPQLEVRVSLDSIFFFFLKKETEEDSPS